MSSFHFLSISDLQPDEVGGQDQVAWYRCFEATLTRIHSSASLKTNFFYAIVQLFEQRDAAFSGCIDADFLKFHSDFIKSVL